jgi:hypothetical protein
MRWCSWLHEVVFAAALAASALTGFLFGVVFHCIVHSLIHSPTHLLTLSLGRRAVVLPLAGSPADERLRLRRLRPPLCGEDLRLPARHHAILHRP